MELRCTCKYDYIYIQWNFSKGDIIGPEPTKLSIVERVSSGQGFIIHYVGYIWDSVSVYYRGMRGVRYIKISLLDIIIIIMIKINYDQRGSNVPVCEIFLGVVKRLARSRTW